MTIALLVASIGLAAMVIFLGFALYLWMAMFAAPPVAALLSAAVSLLFALIVILIARLVTSAMERARKRREAELGVWGPAMAFGALMGKEFLNLSEKNKRAAILASLLAGLAIGASPRLRALLRDLVR